jgi:hypothetical protein
MHKEKEEDRDNHGGHRVSTRFCVFGFGLVLLDWFPATEKQMYV